MPKCTETTDKGMPCRAWAIRGSDPPLCSAHSGRAGGAPAGNKNAETHGAYSESATKVVDIDVLIADLDRRRQQLGEFIEKHLGDLDVKEYVNLVNLEGQLASRIGRLQRDRLQVKGDGVGASELDALINRALDQLAEEWNVDL